MRTYNNFEFIKHDQITFKDLWKDDTHLADSGKVFLARNFIDRAIFFTKVGLKIQKLLL